MAVSDGTGSGRGRTASRVVPGLTRQGTHLLATERSGVMEEEVVRSVCLSAFLPVPLSVADQSLVR